MAILERYVDPAGKIRITWQSEQTGAVYLFKFQTEPTNEQLTELSNVQDETNEYSEVQREEIDVLKFESEIIELITQLKQNPNITFNQYLNYLSNLPWYKSSVFKYLILSFGYMVADYRSIDIRELSEAAVFIGVRNFISNTPNKKLARLIFKNRNEF